MANKELGVIFALDERDGELTNAAVVPITKEGAQKYWDGRIQQREAHKPSTRGPIVPMYWVPLSAFQPLEGSGAEPLSERAVDPREDEEEAPPENS